MLKVAHSFSAFLSFAIACACGVCGFDKSDFSFNQTRDVLSAQSQSQTQNGQTSASIAFERKASYVHALFEYLPAPELFAIQPNIPETPKVACVKILSWRVQTQNYVKVVGYKACQIRAPLMA